MIPVYVYSCILAVHSSKLNITLGSVYNNKLGLNKMFEKCINIFSGRLGQCDSQHGSHIFNMKTFLIIDMLSAGQEAPEKNQGNFYFTVKKKNSSFNEILQLMKYDKKFTSLYSFFYRYPLTKDKVLSPDKKMSV